MIDTVHKIIGPAELYAINGLQFLPFNTIYQLAAEQHSPLWPEAAKIVLLPDLLAYWLTGRVAGRDHQRLDDGLAGRRRPNLV